MATKIDHKGGAMDRVVIIDTETTGLSPKGGSYRIVNLAAVEIIDGYITGSIFDYFLNPEGKKHL